jgi:ABC-type multidrug transport system fused ATPase/permease subunit
MFQIRWIWKNMDPLYRKRYIIALVISLVTTMMGLINPFLSSKLVDEVIVNHNVDPMLRLLLTMLAVLCVQQGLRYLMIIWFEGSAQNVVYNVKSRLFESLQHQEMAFFDRHGMHYHITPGISSFQVAGAALRTQFTIPEKVQTIILTRAEGRTPMPEKEQLHKLPQSQSTMCIYLSAAIVDQVQEELLQAYPPETPVAACYKLTWKEERIYRGQLKDLVKIVKDNNLTLTTLLVVGDAIDNREGLSRLYSHQFKHLFRK